MKRNLKEETTPREVIKFSHCQRDVTNGALHRQVSVTTMMTTTLNTDWWWWDYKQTGKIEKVIPSKSRSVGSTVPSEENDFTIISTSLEEKVSSLPVYESRYVCGILFKMLKSGLVEVSTTEPAPFCWKVTERGVAPQFYIGGKSAYLPYEQ